MALLAAAFVPVPPLLVPQVAGGSAPADDDLRDSCQEAVGRFGERRVIVVGTAPQTRLYRGGYDFRPFGVAFPVDRPRTALPASLGIGCWLLGSAPSRVQGVRADTPRTTCLNLGRLLTADEDVCLLVCADGTACRSERAPGHLDPRAAAFDGRVEAALTAGDPRPLADLEEALAAQLLCAGRAPWQVLAGAASDGRWRAELLHAAAPYGVYYPVAFWERL